ncbi:voltage-dependent anion-selective channel-like [Drosophila obscura]|uniref:voltage-dependent anion-selective channel-like n=1 Tax=Drosophila obscura TaxID=7282 RepID=UPI001BB152B3|nr:voltage-dependent anion-selective channel-like [Drosophila obscura]
MSKKRISSIFRRKREAEKEEDETEQQPQAGTEPKAQDKPKVKDDIEILLPQAQDGMMPSYFHVGGWAKDCLIRGYKSGVWQLRCSSKTENDMALSSFGEGNPDLTSVLGGLDAFKQFENCHTSLTWISSNEWQGELGVRGEVAGGIAHSILRSTLPMTDEYQLKGKLNAGFERSPFKIEAVLPIVKEPTFMGYILVAPAENWLLGYRMVYSLSEKAFDKHAFCVGYKNESSEVGLKLENFKDLRGSIFQRIGESWAVALKMNFYGEEQLKKFAIGCQYQLEDGSLLKAKVRDDGNVGVVFQTKIGENIDVMYHVGCEYKAPISGDHKIGASWTFNC